jgi:hypothetical protein
VNAYKEEEKPNKVSILAGVKKGTKFVGFTPYSGEWTAKTTGSEYTVKVSAPGRKTWEETITLYAGDERTIDAYLEQETEMIEIAIAPSVAYIDKLSVKSGTILLIGKLFDGWVRVETYVPDLTLFYATLTFLDPTTKRAVDWGGKETIYTQGKLLSADMTDTERRLYFPYAYDKDVSPTLWRATSWSVPDKPGNYLLKATLYYWSE